MTTEDFLNLKHFTVHKSQALIPATPETMEWLELKKHNEPVNFKPIDPRDLQFHKGYFAILRFIYKRLNIGFRKQVPEKSFYKWLKMASNEYTVDFEFKDGRQLIEYKSISFSKMNQDKFRIYVNDQLGIIYEELLIQLDQAYIMDLANDEFEKYMSRLI